MRIVIFEIETSSINPAVDRFERQSTTMHKN